MAQNKPFFKCISLYLMVATVLLTLPSQGWAMFIPSSPTTPVSKADMISIQKVLESGVVKQRMMDYGLSSEETVARINSLSNEQIHRIAGHLDSLQAGADGVDSLVFLVLVAIIVVVVLQVTGHKVIVR